MRIVMWLGVSFVLWRVILMNFAVIFIGRRMIVRAAFIVSAMLVVRAMLVINAMLVAVVGGRMEPGVCTVLANCARPLKVARTRRCNHGRMPMICRVAERRIGRGRVFVLRLRGNGGHVVLVHRHALLRRGLGVDATFAAVKAHAI